MKHRKGYRKKSAKGVCRKIGVYHKVKGTIRKVKGYPRKSCFK